MIEWAIGGAIVAVATTAAWFDVRERRIPNALTVSALGIALLARAFGGFPDLGAGLVGAGICLLLALPLFLAGGLGGGDVKLLTAFGAFLGPGRLLVGFVVMALVGGAMALIQMVRKRVVQRTLWNLYVLFKTLGKGTFTGWKKEGSEAWLTVDTPGAVTVPYGVAISAGALYAWFL